MMGRLGPTRSKDFDRGNAPGPFLVTPDEAPDPLSMNVVVKIGSEKTWKGNTSCYSASPAQVVAYVARHQSLLPGTVIGMGTVAECRGLDRDEWIDPGAMAEIRFDGLGVLRTPFPAHIGASDQSRWGSRPDL